MDDDRTPEEERVPTPPGYFGWPEGDDAVRFLHPDGSHVKPEEMDAYFARHRHLVIGSGTAEDPYRFPGTDPTIPNPNAVEEEDPYRLPGTAP